MGEWGVGMLPFDTFSDHLFLAPPQTYQAPDGCPDEGNGPTCRSIS